MLKAFLKADSTKKLIFCCCFNFFKNCSENEKVFITGYVLYLHLLLEFILMLLVNDKIVSSINLLIFLSGSFLTRFSISCIKIFESFSETGTNFVLG